MSRAFESAEKKEVRLDQGTIRYREFGTGEPLIFVHGVLVNGNLWRKVVPDLAEDYRCIVPDLPLGGHENPMNPGADLSPPGLARLLADFLDVLDLHEATLVANDTGGAIAQVLVARYPEWVSRFVLTNADAFENFLPPLLRPIQWGARIPGFVSLLSFVLRSRPVQRALFSSVAKHPVEDRIAESYLSPLLKDARVRRDLRRVLCGISNKYTIEAADKFQDFEKPVLLAWGMDDRLFFPYKYAERLAKEFSDATLEKVPGSRTFVAEDNPVRLIAVIRDFMSKHRIDNGV